MEFVFNDGGRSKYFQGKNAGDCVVRAIANATGIDYKEIYDKLANRSKAYASQRNDKVAKDIRRKNQTSPRNGVHKEIYTQYLNDIGWKFVPTMKIGSGCKVHLKSNELPKGDLIVSVSRHITCVKDGVLHDTYDCTRDEKRCVYGYFIRDESLFTPKFPMEFTASELVSKKFNKKPKQDVTKTVKKYVLELTRKDHDVLCNALFMLGYDIDERINCESYYGKSKTDCEREYKNIKKKIFCDLLTKQQYLRENK